MRIQKSDYQSFYVSPTLNDCWSFLFKKRFIFLNKKSEQYILCIFDLKKISKMTVHQFNAEGISIFTESNLVTEFHAHPALEVILAKAGTFTLKTRGQSLEDIQLGFIEPNCEHLLQAENSTVEIIMIEPGYGVLQQLLQFTDQSDCSGGIHTLDIDYNSIIDQETLSIWSTDPLLMKIYDERILQCIHLIKTPQKSTPLALNDLATSVFLSPDRLSHLFKTQIGVPIQKYIIWNRLKVAVGFILDEQLNLTQAAHKAGFYDSAHFSKHFKEMLGVKPSSVYNSSIVQD